MWISVDSRGPLLLAKSSFCVSGDIWEWNLILLVLLVLIPRKNSSWGSIEVAEWRVWAELGVWFFPIDAPWGGGLLCQERPLCNLKIIKWSQDVTLIPPIGLKSKDLEAFKFLYQEYDKDNKWQSENTGLSSFLKQEARQTAFWYIFKLWSWLHFIMKKINVPFFKAEAKQVKLR